MKFRRQIRLRMQTFACYATYLIALLCAGRGCRCERSDKKTDVWIIDSSETRSSVQRPDVFKDVSEQARTGRTGRFVATLWSDLRQLTTINNDEKKKRRKRSEKKRKSANTRVQER